MPVEDEFIQIGRLLSGEAVQPQVVQDEQVGGQEGPEGAIHRVVDPGLSHGLEETVGVAEADGVSGTDGGIAESCQFTPGRIVGQNAVRTPGPAVSTLSSPQSAEEFPLTVARRRPAGPRFQRPPNVPHRCTCHQNTKYLQCGCICRSIHHYKTHGIKIDAKESVKTPLRGRKGLGNI